MLLSAAQIPTHAQLNPFVFSQCFQEAFQEGYRCLIYTAINAKGSATYQNAVQAREEFYEDYPEAKETFHIHILDSRTYTMGYGWAVVQGARMARDGADEGEVVAYIQDWIDHARVIFAPLDLRFAKKSGRVSAAAAFMGDALGLKPIMTFENGDSKVLSKVRGEKNVVPALLELCRKTRKPGTPYLVIEGNNREQAARLEAVSARIFALAEADPGKEDQLRKFTSYYLPTALKLLHTYAQLDGQGVDGENITKTKQSIERSLDLLVTAFENQLDKLFQSDALDVSADIAALEGMLNLDGLSGANDFTPQ